MTRRSITSLVRLGLALNLSVVACSGGGAREVEVARPVPTRTPTRAPTQAPTPTEPTAATIPGDTTITAGSGGSEIYFPDDTQVTPPVKVDDIRLETVPEEELPPLPAGDRAIIGLEVTPDGMTFNPNAVLRFELPAVHDFLAGEELPVLQYDQAIAGWQQAGTATVDADRHFANGSIAHTSIFALVHRLPVGEALLSNIDDQILAQGHKRIGMFWNVAGDPAVAGILEEHVRERGAELLRIDIEFGTLDFTPLLFFLQAEGAEALIIADLDDFTTETIVAQAFEIGWEGAIYRIDTAAGEVEVLIEGPVPGPG